MITAEQVFEIAMSKIDELLPNGTVDGNTRDEYEQRSLRLITSLQRELMQYSESYKTFEFFKDYIMPVEFDNTERLHEEDYIFEYDGVAQAYYFAVDSSCEVFIEGYDGAWNILDTITIPDTIKAYTGYKGLITPIAGMTKTRLRFSGNYYYKFKNTAFYKEKFRTNDEVPENTSYVRVQMPDDFESIDKIIREYFPAQYVNNVDYTWENRKTLVLNNRFVGNIKIIYKPVSLEITNISQELQIDDITATTTLTDGLAMSLLVTEDPDLSNFFGQRYEELKSDLIRNKPPVPRETITDVY